MDIGRLAVNLAVVAGNIRMRIGHRVALLVLTCGRVCVSIESRYVV